MTRGRVAATFPRSEPDLSSLSLYTDRLAKKSFISLTMNLISENEVKSSLVTTNNMTKTYTTMHIL